MVKKCLCVYFHCLNPKYAPKTLYSQTQLLWYTQGNNLLKVKLNVQVLSNNERYHSLYNTKKIYTVCIAFYVEILLNLHCYKNYIFLNILLKQKIIYCHETAKKKKISELLKPQIWNSEFVGVPCISLH